MEIRRKKIIFISLSIMLIICAILVLSITIPEHMKEIDQCMIPEGCGFLGGKVMGNYIVTLLLLIIAGILLLKYVPLKEKRGKK